jgi:membrane-bound lytic murein transglycosylase A
MGRAWGFSSWLLLAGALLAGCVSPEPLSTPPGQGASQWRTEPAAPQAPPAPSAMLLAALPGWQEEDHLGALAAVVKACAVTKDPAFASVCGRALALQGPSDDNARRFLEANFTAWPLAGTGLLTGYFSPVYQASRDAREAFTAPVRARPPAIVDPPGPPGAAPVGEARAAIEASPPDYALAWMRPEDLFVLQMQGSGVLEFADGGRARAVFAGSNGQPFRGIAEPMRQRGLIADKGSSADAIHDWLAANRGSAAEAIMDLDPRYVFFRLAPADGAGARGSAGIALAPGRSLAIDPASHAMGELLWVDADAPGLTGARPAYRRLAVALDTGGAIKGLLRADLFVGEGQEAGLEAGRIRHALRLYRLAPRP